MSEPFEKDVHTEHCCIVHGCKYGDEDCPVATGAKLQSYACEACDGVHPQDRGRTHDQLPADIAEAIEAFGKAARETGWNCAARVQMAAKTARTALHAAILARLSIYENECFMWRERAQANEAAIQKLTDLGRSALAEEGGGR